MAASTEVQDVHQLRRTFRPLSSAWPRKAEGGVIGAFREHYRISVTSSLVPQLPTFSNAMASSQYQSEALKRLGKRSSAAVFLFVSSATSVTVAESRHDDHGSAVRFALARRDDGLPERLPIPAA